MRPLRRSHYIIQRTITSYHSRRLALRTRRVVGAMETLPAPSGIPSFTTDDLDLDEDLTKPLGHGGHSLVFKVHPKSLPSPSVLKIFRFTIPPPPTSRPSSVSIHPRHPDYAYYLSELSSYTLLSPCTTDTPPKPLQVPTLQALVTPSPSFINKYIQPLYSPQQHRLRRRGQLRPRPSSQEELEARLLLKGILISFIPGFRLSAFRTIPMEISEKIMSGMEYIHERGVVHRDVKKRNVMIIPNRADAAEGRKDGDGDECGDKGVDSDETEIELDGTEEVVWIDFSNSLVLEDFTGERDEQLVKFFRVQEEEKEEIRKMIRRLER